MFCKSCGRQIDNDSTFCSFCGTKQSTDLKPQVQADTNQSINTTQKVYSNETNFNNTPNIVRQPKYDPTYKKEDDAMTVGIILLVIAVIFAIVGPIQFEDRESYGQFKAVTAIVSLILRIIITVWVVNIAKRQNRETFGWGLFAFFLPSIALIVIATRKKLFANVQVVEGLDNEQNSKILSDKAQEYYNDNKYSESIRFSEKAIELNPENEIAKEVLKKSKVAFAEANNVSSSVQTVFRETTDGRLLKIISKLNQTIGADVFIDDLPAPDGVYNYKSGTHKLVIENGKIKERYFIERVKNIVVEKTNEHSAQKGDKVFLDTGNPAPTGKYSMGFMASKLIVEDGKFVRYE
ncbi:MAG: zinc-ribbon domain-containing protein [Lacibacter sp.]|jgi:tetratricopeptide (TPR) repeat protein